MARSGGASCPNFDPSTAGGIGGGTGGEGATGGIGCAGLTTGGPLGIGGASTGGRTRGSLGGGTFGSADFPSADGSDWVGSAGGGGTGGNPAKVDGDEAAATGVVGLVTAPVAGAVLDGGVPTASDTHATRVRNAGTSRV